jgi:hypothetical protein
MKRRADEVEEQKRKADDAGKGVKDVRDWQGRPDTARHVTHTLLFKSSRADIASHVIAAIQLNKKWIRKRVVTVAGNVHGRYCPPRHRMPCK